MRRSSSSSSSSADLEGLEKRLDAIQKKAKSGDKEAAAILAQAEPILKLLQEGKPARAHKPKDREERNAFAACSC